MIRPSNALPEVFLHRDAVDMRKGANGLAAIVQEEMGKFPGSGEVFVFCSRTRDKIKLLTWEVNGFVIWYKRLEKQRFQWPDFLNGDPIILTGEQLNWLLDGINLNVVEKHQPISFQYVA